MAKKSEAMILWEQSMIEEAEKAASLEANHVGGIPSIHFSNAGKMTFNDEAVPGDEIAVVIVGSFFHNRYYKQTYDPRSDEKFPPVCWASGTTEDEMLPSAKATEPQNEEGCLNCPWNQWNSADRGRGKACQNRRLIHVVDAGTFDKNGDLELHSPEEFAAGSLIRVNLPATAIKSWAKYVKGLYASRKRPPFGVITRFATEPADGNGFDVIFEDLDLVDYAYAEAVMAKVDDAKNVPVPEYDYADSGDSKSKAKKKTGTRKAKPAPKKATTRKAKAAPKRKVATKKSGTRRGNNKY